MDKKDVVVSLLAVTLIVGVVSYGRVIAKEELTDTTINTDTTVENEVIYVEPQIVEEDKSPYFELSDHERWVVECIVMGEAGGESWDGKRLVAQCILNACLRDGILPSEVRNQYKYAGWNDNPSDEVRAAVSAVFDDGNVVTDEPILWFYAPKYCTSNWHETQVHVLTEGGHKFFKEHTHDWW